jgi:predicted transcriptional regulator
MANHDPVLKLTAGIVAAYVGGHPIRPQEIPALISEVAATLTGLGQIGDERPGRSMRLLGGQTTGVVAGDDMRETKPVPAVEIKASVFHDHLLCLECGAWFVTIRRHIREAHGMEPREYRAKWSLPGSYPMVAPNYTKTRSNLAKRMGLGKTPASRRQRVG